MSTFITVSGSLPKEAVVFEKDFYTYAGCLRFKLVPEQWADWDSVYDAQDAFFNGAYEKLLGKNDEITKRVIEQAGETGKVGLLTPEIAKKRIDQEMDFNFNMFEEIPASWMEDYKKMPVISIAKEFREPFKRLAKGATRDAQEQEEEFVELPKGEFLVDVVSLYRHTDPPMVLETQNTNS